MDPARTNTQIYRPAEVVDRLTRQHNTGTHYTQRHSTAEPVTMPVRLPAPAQHWPQHAATEQIPLDRIRAVLALPTTGGPGETSRIPVPQMPLAMPAVHPGRPGVEVPEPAAEVTVGLLERIRRALRGLR